MLFTMGLTQNLTLELHALNSLQHALRPAFPHDLTQAYFFLPTSYSRGVHVVARGEAD